MRNETRCLQQAFHLQHVLVPQAARARLALRHNSRVVALSCGLLRHNRLCQHILLVAAPPCEEKSKEEESTVEKGQFEDAEKNTFYW